MTIRSRCRVVPLRQPRPDAIAALLRRRDGTDDSTAAWAAAAAQGHVGRARRLARDPQARARRDAVLAVPRRLTGVGACFDAANSFIEAAEAEAAASVTEVDTRERTELETALGAGGTGRGASNAIRGAQGQLKDLERRQKSRATRAQRDAMDRALVDLAGFYRDVLAHSFGAPVDPVHADARRTVVGRGREVDPGERAAPARGGPRVPHAIEANVKPRIAVEAMMLALWRG